RAQIHTWIASLPLQEVREGGNLGHALPGDVRLFGVDSSAQIETEVAEEEREGVVASSANLRIGPGRASGSRTARTEATGGEDGDTHRTKSACQATPAVTSQGVPRGDLIEGGVKKRNFKIAKGGPGGGGAGALEIENDCSRLARGMQGVLEMIGREILKRRERGKTLCLIV